MRKLKIEIFLNLKKNRDRKIDLKLEENCNPCDQKKTAHGVGDLTFYTQELNLI